MKFEKTDIDELVLVHADPFIDSRGIFRRNFCVSEFAAAGLNSTVFQANISINHNAGTFRGFHGQRAPHGEYKTLTCLSGGIRNFTVDLRRKSVSYLKVFEIDLTATEYISIQVPAGCVNGFYTLEDNTVIHYYVSEQYCPEAEFGLRYDDPSINIRLPGAIREISIKDESWPNWE